jgi:hypothetical protein
MRVSPIVSSATLDELKYIAGLDYGQNDRQHLNALHELIHVQSGVINRDQFYFPYEVVELGSNVHVLGHEREFAICTLLIIANVVAGADTATDLSQKFSDRSQDYDQLPLHLKEAVLNAFYAAEA